MKGRIFVVMAILCIVANFVNVGDAQSPQASLNDPILVKALDLSDTADGEYVLTIQGSSITLVPLLLVRPNVPNPPLPPDGLNERAKKYKAAAASVTGDPKKDETQAVLSALYNQVSQVILDNGLTDYRLIGALVQASEKQILDRQKAVEQWKPVTDLMSDELAKVAATSETTAADFASCLTDAADGLDNGENLDPIWIELIIQIIKMILERLLDEAAIAAAAAAAAG
jgi:hypothetical protein